MGFVPEEELYDILLMASRKVVRELMPRQPVRATSRLGIFKLKFY